MKKIIKLENLDCANCAAKMERGINALEGVIKANVSFMNQRLILEAEDELFDKVVEEALKVCKKVDKDVNFVK